VQTVLPLPWSEVSIEAVNATRAPAVIEPVWFWRGAKQAEKWRAKLRDILNRRASRQ
jgi:hypothetical protein